MWNGAEFIHVTLCYVTAQYPVTWLHIIGLVRQLSCLKWRPQISFLLGPGCKSSRLQSVVGNAGECLYKKWIKDIDELCAHILTALDKMDQRITGRPIDKAVSGTHVFMHALKLKTDTLNIYCVSNVFLPCDAMPSAVYAGVVCMSVCLAHSGIVSKWLNLGITPHDSPTTLVFWSQRSWRNLNGITPYGGDKCRRGGLKLATFDEKLTITRKRYKIDA